LRRSLGFVPDRMDSGLKEATPIEELKKSKDALVSTFQSGSTTDAFEERYTEIIDHYFRRSLQESKAGQDLFREKIPYAFVAVGGYGRRDLCLHSDVDILILFASKIPPKATGLAREILYPLWDLGFDLGYGIRNLKDCISLSREDYPVLTSVMDARFICGDSPLFLSLLEQFQKKALKKKAAEFAGWLEGQHQVRRNRFGDASFLLEPHLKEGIGGLRDYHHVLWLAKSLLELRVPRDLEYLGVLSHKEYADLSEHLKFIHLARNHLHHLSGRKNDRLDFEHQVIIAKRLGFKTHGGSLDVEQFLGNLHVSMSFVKSIRRSFVGTHFPKKGNHRKVANGGEVLEGFTLHQNELFFNSATDILLNPLLLMKVFEESTRLSSPLSMEAKRLVGEFLYLVEDGFRTSEKATQGFLKILNGGPYSLETLDQMSETGFLESYIPELKPIRDRVQFDAYHIYPVGRHALETLKNLKNPAKEKDLILLDIFSDLKKPEVLFLAGLFHDVGKVGKDHAPKGVGITRNILRRFHYEKEEMEQILFLVRHHLLLVETATRRDLNDEKEIIQCARLIEDPEKLKMLYLLTWADSRATGPRAWSGWIANLVQELFFKILHLMTDGDLATPDASRKTKKTKSELKKETAEKMNADELEALFEVMPPRYLLNTPPKEIALHLDMLKPLRKCLEKDTTAFHLAAKENEVDGCWDLTFLAKDRTGLFSDIAGVLALHNINILSAHIYTWLDGTAADLFKVSSPMDPIHSQEIWERVRRDLKQTFEGKISLEHLLRQKSAPTVLSSPGKPSRPPQVIVNNDSSDFFTLIEIFSDDRVGLLYSVTSTLFHLNLDIRVAKIATKGDQVADVFYVRNLWGEKVEEEDQVREIRSALLHRLGKTEEAFPVEG
jgi:[protein-PII] uridylyltransferase